MSDKYSITRTQNTVYLDKAGKAVTGFTVSVYFPEWEEELDIKVPSLNAKDIEAAINKLYADRMALSKLGKV